MDDVLCLDHVRRRRRQARHDVAHLGLRRRFLSGAVAFAELGHAAREARDSALDAVATFEVELIWERLCSDGPR